MNAAAAAFVDAPGPSTADLLARARAILERETWNRGVLAANKEGDRVSFWSKEACQFCALGALYRAAHELDLPPDVSTVVYAEEVVLASLVDGPRHRCPPRWVTLAEWNDADDRTREQVLAAFARAEARERSGGAS